MRGGECPGRREDWPAAESGVDRNHPLLSTCWGPRPLLLSTAPPPKGEVEAQGTCLGCPGMVFPVLAGQSAQSLWDLQVPRAIRAANTACGVGKSSIPTQSRHKGHTYHKVGVHSTSGPERALAPCIHHRWSRVPPATSRDLCIPPPLPQRPSLL